MCYHRLFVTKAVRFDVSNNDVYPPIKKIQTRYEEFFCPECGELFHSNYDYNWIKEGRLSPSYWKETKNKLEGLATYDELLGLKKTPIPHLIKLYAPQNHQYQACPHCEVKFTFDSNTEIYFCYNCGSSLHNNHNINNIIYLPELWNYQKLVEEYSKKDDHATGMFVFSLLGGLILGGIISLMLFLEGFFIISIILGVILILQFIYSWYRCGSISNTYWSYRHKINELISFVEPSP